MPSVAAILTIFSHRARVPLGKCPVTDFFSRRRLGSLTSFGQGWPINRRRKRPGVRWGGTIPEAGWGSGKCGRQEAQNGASQERQFGQAPDPFRVVNKPTAGADHSPGAPRDALRRPAVFVDCPHTFRLEGDWRRQQPGLFERRVGDGVPVKNPVLRVRRPPFTPRVRQISARSWRRSSSQADVSSGGVAASVVPLYRRANGRTNVPYFALRPQRWSGRPLRRAVKLVAGRMRERSIPASCSALMFTPASTTAIASS